MYDIRTVLSWVPLDIRCDMARDRVCTVEFSYSLMLCCTVVCRSQVLAEGVLRKAMKKDRVLRWDLCLSAADSVARRANLAQSSSSGESRIHVGVCACVPSIE